MTQAEALDILKMGHSVFLTGPAGSGKTFVLNKYIEYLREHDIEPGITASTGIAASHLSGMTIHAWSGLGIREYLTAEDFEALEEKPYLWKRFAGARVLVIDEISMLKHSNLDSVEELCRFFKRTTEPWGGLQVVLCGDFFQLPPVVRNEVRRLEPDLFDGIDEGYSAPKTAFAYHAKAWKKMSPVICYLDEQHRQGGIEFLDILNAIRRGEVKAEIKQRLTERLGRPAKLSIEPTKLYTHNANVDTENERELSRLPGQIFEYGMTARGREALSATLKKSCLAPELLRLKKGARVMFVKNNFEQGFVNGTLGIVERLSQYEITVRTVSGTAIVVEPATWVIDEEGKIKAEIAQYPLRLAYAITVHKSQGMSLDAAEIDLSRSFEPGMGYVALSRVRSLDGLCLLGINDMALRVHDEVLERDREFAEASEREVENLRGQGAVKVKARQEEYLNRLAPKTTGQKSKKGKVPKLSTIEQTRLLIEEGKGIRQIATARSMMAGTILDHCEKIKEQDPRFDFRPLIKNSGLSVSSQQKIRRALTQNGMENGKYLLTPAREILGSGYSFDEIRLVRLAI
ncbi:MAG: AAA family ATPase [Candidatus Vogelbacteria bacterium]|nr:AAA family ATPase [Candidatus Vogelbacteria bacterium]